MEVDALHNQDFSYDQTHQVFHVHHETLRDQLDAQGLTDGNEQVAGESGLYATSKGKGGPTFQGTCHHCKLVCQLSQEKILKCSSFDP